MIRWSRRELLAAGIAAAAGAGCAHRRPTGGSADRHHFVTLHLLGGYDPLLSFYPLEASSPGVDVELRADDRLRGQRRFYGPLFAPLMPFEEEICLVHGVRGDTTDHVFGGRELLTGTAKPGKETPMVGDHFGDQGDAPIRHLHLGWNAFDQVAEESIPTQAVWMPHYYLSTWLHPEQCQPEVPGWLSALRSAQGVAAPQTAALDRLAGALCREQPIPRERLDGDFETRTTAQLAMGLEAAFVAIRDNLARSISVTTEFLWLDSHMDNLAVQTKRLPKLLADVATFIHKLKTTRDEQGTLFDRTTLAIGTEMGRYPKLNVARGKDHWPENSWLLLGRGIRRAPGGLTLGGLDAKYRGRRIDFRSGSFDSDQARPIFIDDITATLLELAGAKRPAWVKGEALRCALA